MSRVALVQVLVCAAEAPAGGKIRLLHNVTSLIEFWKKIVKTFISCVSWVNILVRLNPIFKVWYNVIASVNDCLSNLIAKMSECAKLCSLFLSTPGSLTEHHPLVGWSGLWKSQKIIPKFLTMVSS